MCTLVLSHVSWLGIACIVVAQRHASQLGLVCLGLALYILSQSLTSQLGLVLCISVSVSCISAWSCASWLGLACLGFTQLSSAWSCALCLGLMHLILASHVLSCLGLVLAASQDQHQHQHQQLPAQPHPYPHKCNRPLNEVPACVSSVYGILLAAAHPMPRRIVMFIV